MQSGLKKYFKLPEELLNWRIVMAAYDAAKNKCKKKMLQKIDIKCKQEKEKIIKDYEDKIKKILEDHNKDFEEFKSSNTQKKLEEINKLKELEKNIEDLNLQIKKKEILLVQVLE